LAIAIGLSLGLIGGGGSILTLPVLVYLIGLDPMKATSYSLFIVGMTALIGATEYLKKGLIDIKAGFIFAIPSFIAVIFSRKYLLPSIPEHITNIGSFEVTKGTLIMILFAVLMVFASVSMIRQRKMVMKLIKESEGIDFNYPLIFIEGIIVGILTGVLGAGGGFLIIPALVLFTGIPMKTAVGTSLMIIACNSLVGFTTDLMKSPMIDWPVLLSFSCFAFAGILLGTYLSGYINNNKLKPAFGWFTLAMGIFIMIKELIVNIN
jgi:uncharacterized membrane protein YfcA